MLVEVGVVDQRRHPRQVYRTVAAVQVELLQFELLQEQLGQVCRTARGDFEAHREAELALRQFAFERLPQVLDFFLVEPQIRVARHPELRIVDHLAAGEQVVEVCVDDRGEQHKGVVGRDFLRQFDDPRQQAWRLDDGDRGLAPECVFPR